jgi:hypothetical protein
LLSFRTHSDFIVLFCIANFYSSGRIDTDAKADGHSFALTVPNVFCAGYSGRTDADGIYATDICSITSSDGTWRIDTDAGIDS